MFKYYRLEDIISLEVSEYLEDTQRILRGKLEERYVDKVVSGVGLVVLIESITNTSKPTITPNDANALFVVDIKLLVFCPERGERIKGTVMSSDRTGIGISLGFFSDIKVIPHFMPKNASFDKEQRSWYLDEGEHKRHVKVNSNVVITVVGVTYNELNDASADDQLPVMLVLGTIP